MNIYNIIMNTNNKSVIGQFVKFKTNKYFAPAEKDVTTYGYVTNHIRGAYFGVVYAYEDGEFGEEMVHVSRLDICPDGEIVKAVDSALLWADSANKDMLGRMKYYTEKGDEMSLDNLEKKNVYIKKIKEYGNGN